MVNIPWATSIPPHIDAAEQKARIVSWGGHTSSFHHPDELPLIAEAYPEISNELVMSTGAEILGKPVPLLADILAKQYDSEAEIYGLMNADITLEATPAQRAWLREKAKTGLVCIRRTEVESVDMPLSQGHQLSQGYDTFLYPRALMPELIVHELCLGAPFWDFWMPVAAVLAGFPVTVVTAPIARHLEHDTKWGHAALYYMDAFIHSVHAAAIRQAEFNPVISALCAHSAAAYGAWSEFASQSDEAAALQNQILDDFQSRMMSVVTAHAETFSQI